ncbi:MAG TPA: 50S ribosomal protein L28 [Dehalococcoidia bacterium]|nr:50S ribosomal protein L28 [Dehalococcoidia bacterium]
MPAKCDICGKTPQFGHNVSHSKRSTNRRWLPNVRRATVVIEGVERRVHICTRCLRSQHKLARRPKASLR